MRKLLFVFVVLFVCQGLFAQQPQGTPPREEAPVVKISTDLIQLDVTVTDKNGKVVTGLSAGDFEIFENGEKQKISNLTFISRTSGGATVTGGAPAAAQPAGLPPQPLTAGQVRRTIAIVVDDLNLSFASVYYTRAALKRFVDTQMEPNDLVAIIRTGGGVGALQQFTSDKRILYAAIERIRWNALGNGGIESLTSVGQNERDITERFAGESDAVAAKAGNDSSGRKTSTIIRRSLSETIANVPSRALDDLRAASYAQTSLGTIKYIVGGMNELPGRKVMMLFSDGLTIRSDIAKSRSSMVYQYLQDVIDFTNRSSVVVYTFDTRGMKSMAIAASDSTYEVIDGHREQKQLIRLDDFKANQEGLAFFASQTGGKALLNSNDLNGGIQRVLDEQTGYYLLGYIPDSETFDAAKRRFNKIEVRVARPGLNVSYRSGFFNTNTTPNAVQDVSVERSMAKALMSPFAQNDITLQMNALYANDPKDGPYIRSFLHIDAKDLAFSDEAGGWKKATFDIAAVAFGDNGVPVEKVESQYVIRTKGATYDAMLKKGFMYVLVMPFKKPGVYQYRAALRDSASGKIGSASQVVEVPDLARQKLTISSLAVENLSPTVWQKIVEGKVGSQPGQVQIPSTLLYDTVLKSFRAGSVLRYGYEVYNAKPGGAARPQLETQIRILQNDRVVVEGVVSKPDTSAQTTGAPVRISNAVMLKEALPPGDYVLELMVNDLVTKQRAYQLFMFEVTK
jgi:VWFA-related protein